MAIKNHSSVLGSSGRGAYVPVEEVPSDLRIRVVVTAPVEYDDYFIEPVSVGK